MRRQTTFLFVICIFLCTVKNATAVALNDPYPANQANKNIYYGSFPERPKTFDPAKSYNANEHVFTVEIVEPVLQYDYLKRPYELMPLTAAEMPTVKYYDVDGKEIPDKTTAKVAYTTYTIRIKPGIYYQPHPAFAKKSDGEYQYYPLPKHYLATHFIRKLSDFKHTGTRELLASDYVYEIKRLATPSVNSTISGFMSQYILGFEWFGNHLPDRGYGKGFLDLRRYELLGAKTIDRYTFQITLIGEYEQFMYWLAMPFFSPVPWEVDRFYAQPGMDKRNLNMSWYPVGTGPFLLSENNPNARIVLLRNPNYRPDYFPRDGSAEDVKKGYMRDPTKPLPYIDQVIAVLEKESIPRWSKFLQGYYDASTLSADSFDQAIQVTPSGKPVVTEVMKDKGIQLRHDIEPSIFYMGFNMLDPIVGGKSERARKLRHAISIAVDFEEFITIFMNGRGKVAQGPIPPGLFGYREGKEGVNPVQFTWDGRHKKRRSIREARRLMAEAGYPNGRDPASGKPLILNYDVPATMGPDDKARLDWTRNQFRKIGISLNVRATHYNRFQEKMRAGNAQIYSWGWSADYPDPENFLFLLYGPHGKVKFGGENASNYDNPKFDALFQKLKNLPNNDERQALLDKAIAILRHDAPWVWGYYSENLILSQSWLAPLKASVVPMSRIKYIEIDVPKRYKLRERWNQPTLWPLGVLGLVLLLTMLPYFYGYHKRQKASAPRMRTEGKRS